MLRLKKAKREKIEEAWKAGEIKNVGTGYSMPLRFSALGITPMMVAQVIAELESRIEAGLRSGKRGRIKNAVAG